MEDLEPAPRPRRSALLVPASRPKALAGAGRFDADEVVMDLAGVARSEKDTARAAVADALQSHDYGESTVSVRINGIDTMWAYRDVVDVVERAGEFVDGIVIGGVAGPGDVEFVDNLLRMISERIDLDHHVGITAQIDTASGLTLIDEIAVSSDRLDALVFDSAAMSAALGAAGPDHGRHGDPWRGIRMQVLVAARAAGVQAIEAHAVTDDGFRGAAQRSHDLGYDGVTCTDPGQVAMANEIFTAM